MARFIFGGTYEDRIETQDSSNYVHPAPGSTLTFWSAITGGSQYTDLLLGGIGGSAASTITADANGFTPTFAGPDGVTSMYVAADGSARKRMDSHVSSAGFMPVITPEQYGAVGDGTTNDAAAFASAITAAGVGGRVFCGPKRYKLNSGITLPVWCKLEGTASNLGSGSSATTELLFTGLTGATTGITMGSESQVENLVVRGPGYNVGTVKGISGATIRLRRVSIVGFATGVLSTGGYYNGFTEVEWLRNGTGLTLSACYNVDLYGCRFDCTTAATYGTAINAGTVRGLNIYGGAIESYATGISLTAASQLGLFGVYFESAAASGIGIAGNAVAGLTMNVQNCMVYLDNHNIWLRMDTSTSATLTARSNHFVASTGSATTPTAYFVTPGQDVDIAGDNWNEVAKVGSAYADTSSGNVLGARLRIAWPVGSSSSLGASANPVTTDARIRICPQTDQTLASNGAVTFNAASEKHRVTLNANATSSSITNAVNGQEVSITFEQDATGSRTYVWPTTCRFTGNSAPSGTAASTRNTVKFTYDSSAGKFYEISRATAVPTT